ncbi:helix-turn-helix transcriptional regulator [Planctomycetota bacterium]
MKPGRLQRLLQILLALQDGKHTADDLARLFETSRRTIFRDLRMLEEMGICHRVNPRTGCYTLDTEACLPAQDLSREEALSLLLMARRAGSQLNLPHKRSALLAALKIQSNLAEPVRRYCDRALEGVSARAHPVTDSGTFDAVFDGLQRAIVLRRRVRIQYALAAKVRPLNIELNPRHLHYDHPRWYLLARESTEVSVRIYKVSHIRKVEMLSTGFPDDAPIDPSTVLGRAWSIKPEGRLHHVRLRFSAGVADRVLDVQWHDTQQVIPQADGSTIVEFRVDGLFEITWWILSHGDQVEVLAPRILREKVHGIASKMAETHRSSK